MSKQLDPDVVEAFPNAQAVNQAFGGSFSLRRAVCTSLLSKSSPEHYYRGSYERSRHL